MQLVRILLRQRTFKKGPDERDMGGEGLSKELIPLVRQIDLDAPPVTRDRLAANQPLVGQSVEHTGQCSFSHQRCGGQFGAGHPLGVPQRGDDVELGRSQPEQPDMPAVRAAEGEIGLDQRAQHLEDRVIFEIGQFHVERAA